MGKSIHVITETRQEWSQRKSDEILVLNILLPLFFGFIFGAIIYFLTYNLIFTGIFFILGIFVYTKLYRLIFPKKGSRGKKQKSFSSKWVWIVLALVAIFLVWNNFSTLKEMIPSNTSPPNLNSYSSLSFEERFDKLSCCMSQESVNQIYPEKGEASGWRIEVDSSGEEVKIPKNFYFEKDGLRVTTQYYTYKGRVYLIDARLIDIENKSIIKIVKDCVVLECAGEM